MLPDRDPRADKGVRRDPGVVFDSDRLTEQGEVRFIEVVRTGTEVAVLADGDAVADGDPAQGVQIREITDHGIGPERDVPGALDPYGGADACGGIDGSSEKTQDPSAVAVAAVPAPAPDGRLHKPPQHPADLLTGSPRADVAVVHGRGGGRFQISIRGFDG
ncbi:MAG: hypothetical protein AAF986_03620, partial [Pseudomonadota bacterium]